LRDGPRREKSCAVSSPLAIDLPERALWCRQFVARSGVLIAGRKGWRTVFDALGSAERNYPSVGRRLWDLL